MAVNAVKHFSVIGAGNLGAHLIHALMEKDLHLAYVFEKSKFPCFDTRITPDIHLLAKESDFIVIATQESKIDDAVRLLLSSKSLEGKIVFHTANSLTSTQLQPLKKRGAWVASFSPLQTFPPFRYEENSTSQDSTFENVYFLTEGDTQAVSLAKDLARRLKAKLLQVPKEKKVLIHIAAVAASNFLVSILKLAENQLKKAPSESKTNGETNRSPSRPLDNSSHESPNDGDRNL